MCPLKKLAVLASTLSLGLLTAALVGCDAKGPNTADNPKDTSTTKTQAEVLAYGKRLATMGECISCHTPIRPWTEDGTPGGNPVLDDDGNPVVGPDVKFALLAGGNAWLTPQAGIGVSPNLTTGGSFLKGDVEDIVDAWLTSEKRYLPPMPQLAEVYTKDELTAIVTYLKSVPAQSMEVPDTYYFQQSKKGDKTWPAPGWMIEGLKAADSAYAGKAIPGNLEISIAPGLDQAYGQDLIDANHENALMP